MKKSKKMITASVVVALTAACIAGGTMAFFTDRTSATNTLTCASGISGSLTESNWVGDEVTQGSDINLTKTYFPDQALEKNPVIHIDRSSGTDAYVAIKVIYQDSEGNAISKEDFDQYATLQYWKEQTDSQEDTQSDNQTESQEDTQFQNGCNTEEWQEYKLTDDNVYFYVYKTAVKKESETEDGNTSPLFDQVLINGAESLVDENGNLPEFRISLSGFAVQTVQSKGDTELSYYAQQLATLANVTLEESGN